MKSDPFSDGLEFQVRAKTPGLIDTFLEWLSTRPADSLTAVVVDGDRLLAEAVLGYP
ncbi:MAG: hypothetical protein KJ000_11445 [Pirellulaceae bacterium]|nr:hypothetical protein [Pirellulaceae bacterium]